MRYVVLPKGDRVMNMPLARWRILATTPSAGRITPLLAAIVAPERVAPAAQGGGA